MARRPRTLVVARDPGAAAALAPVAGSGPAIVIGLGTARAHFDRLGIACEGPSDDADSADVDRVVDRIAPEVVLTGTSLRVSRDAAWWEAARRRSLPAVALLDHWTRYRERFSLALPFDRLPDVVAVMDARARSRMVALGCAADRVSVTGQPAFDRLLAGALGDRASARRRWQAGEGEWVILFVSEPIEKDHAPSPPFTERDVLGVFLRAAEGLPVRAIVRPHPRESPAAFAGTLAAAPVPALLDATSPTADALAGADTVVGIGSVLLFEAALAGLPVLSIQPADDPEIGSLTGQFPELISLARDARGARAWLEVPEHRHRLADDARRERNARSGLVPDAAARVWELLARCSATYHRPG